MPIKTKGKILKRVYKSFINFSNEISIKLGKKTDRINLNISLHLIFKLKFSCRIDKKYLNELGT